MARVLRLRRVAELNATPCNPAPKFTLSEVEGLRMTLVMPDGHR